jgi:hypothetical protein
MQLPVAAVNIQDKFSNTEYTLPAHSSGWRNLEKVIITNNDTHIIISFKWSDDMPLATTRSIDYYRRYILYLDLDNNITTGEVNYGYELLLNVYQQSYEPRHYIYFNLYNESGAIIDSQYIYNMTEWVPGNPTFNITMPLEFLNLAPNDVFSIIYMFIKSGSTDNMLEGGGAISLINTTIPQASIVVDGDTADWTGISPLVSDTIETPDPDYQEGNLTYIYLATDNDFLYMRLDFGDYYNYTKYFNDSIGIGQNSYFGLNFYIDSNNDGSSDYYLRLSYNNVYVYRYSDGYRIWLYPQSSDLELHQSPEGIFEYRVPLNYLGLQGDLIGREITITISGATFEVYARPINTYYSSYFSRPRAVSDKIIYKINYGWYAAFITNHRYSYLNVGSGGFTLNDVQINYDVSGTTAMVFAIYNNDPTGYSNIKALSNYYLIRFTDATALVNGIRLIIQYNEDEVNNLGINENDLWFYYFDHNTRAFRPYDLSYVVPDMNLVLVQIAPEDLTGAYFIGAIGEYPGASANLTTTIIETETIIETSTVTSTIIDTVTETVTSNITHTITSTATETVVESSTITETESMTVIQTFTKTLEVSGADYTLPIAAVVGTVLIIVGLMLFIRKR